MKQSDGGCRESVLYWLGRWWQRRKQLLYSWLLLDTLLSLVNSLSP